MRSRPRKPSPAATRGGRRGPMHLVRQGRTVPASWLTQVLVAVLLAVGIVGLASGIPAGAAPRGRDPWARTRLTEVADVGGGTALAWRRDDPVPYLARQSGQVVPLVDGEAGRPVLDLSGQLATAGSEQGLLGLVFAPDGRHMYVYFTATGGVNTLAEYPVTSRPGRPLRIAEAAGRTLLRVPHIPINHNGGQIAFGPDGLLYVAMGDGGGDPGSGPGQVPGGNSQSLDTLLGKILRIDPVPSGEYPYTVPADNPYADGGGRPEIWHFGLRNPWRFSFDRATGDLWIGDVGQNDWEEIDTVPGTARGVNFGWPRLEGSHRFLASEAPGTVLPVHELAHEAGYCSVTGGMVYRGTTIPALRGAYVFTDYCTGELEAIRVRGGRVVAHRTSGLGAARISTFAEDPDGELYVVSQESGVLRVEHR